MVTRMKTLIIVLTIPFLVSSCTMKAQQNQTQEAQPTIFKASDPQSLCRLKCRPAFHKCTNKCGSDTAGTPPNCTSKCDINFHSCQNDCSGKPDEELCRDQCVSTNTACRLGCKDPSKPPGNELVFCGASCGLKYSACLDKCDSLPQCNFDTDCGPNFICVNKNCLRAIGNCRSDNDCKKFDSYSTCVGGACT